MKAPDMDRRSWLRILGLGTVTLAHAGPMSLTVEPIRLAGKRCLMNLRSATLIPVPASPTDRGAP